MIRNGALLFPAALGLSATAHLLFLFLWPYAPARPVQQPPELIAVRLLRAPRPAPRLPAVPRPRAASPAVESPAPEQAPAPVAQPLVPRIEPELKPALPEAPLELSPPEPSSASAEAAAPEPDAAISQSGAGAEASAAFAAEIAATRAVLSNLRARIVEKIRYPPLARANGWKGTVLLELLLDERGALQGLAVRRSSGYAVLDKAATALMRGVTPVDNPLGRPLRIEVPIAYELKE